MESQKVGKCEILRPFLIYSEDPFAQDDAQKNDGRVVLTFSTSGKYRRAKMGQFLVN